MYCIYVIKENNHAYDTHKGHFMNVPRHVSSSTVNANEIVNVIVFPRETVFRIHFISYRDYTNNTCDNDTG